MCSGWYIFLLKRRQQASDRAYRASGGSRPQDLGQPAGRGVQDDG